MAALGYEFYLRVLIVSLTSERSKGVRDTITFVQIKNNLFSSFSNGEKVVINR